MEIISMSQNTYYWLPDAGVLPLNDTNFGAGVINPRKGDSSFYPRVMLKAYTWRKCLSC